MPRPLHPAEEDPISTWLHLTQIRYRTKYYATVVRNTWHLAPFITLNHRELGAIDAFCKPHKRHDEIENLNYLMHEACEILRRARYQVEIAHNVIGIPYLKVFVKRNFI